MTILEVRAARGAIVIAAASSVGRALRQALEDGV